jgi:hypothetical protein
LKQVNGPEVPEGVAVGGVPLGTGACMRPGAAKNSDLVRRRKEGVEPACIRPDPLKKAYEEAPRRTSASATTPEPTSARTAARANGAVNEEPPVLGSAVAVAVGLAVAVAVGLAVAVAVAVGLVVAVAVAVGLAVMAPPCCSARAADANSRTSSALTVTKSNIFFTEHLLQRHRAANGTPFPVMPNLGVCIA